MMKFADAPETLAARVPRKRGRPGAESPQEKLARLEREIAATRAAMREAERRRSMVIGDAAAAEATQNPAFHAQLAEILARRVTSPSARADIAAFIAPSLALRPTPGDIEHGPHAQGEAA